MSFEVSWILRVAADKTEQKARPILYRKCNEILFKLLGICESNDIIIKEIKVWKEWDNIDVLANVIITVNGKEERHVIVIENKIYTKMKVNQRDDYPKKIRKEYSSYKWPNCFYHFCVINCYDNDKEKSKLKNFCNNTEWKIFNYYDFVNWDIDTKTESEIFNEFWYSKWESIPD